MREKIIIKVLFSLEWMSVSHYLIINLLTTIKNTTHKWYIADPIAFCLKSPNANRFDGEHVE
jgi:hypothetical protein